MKMKTIKTNSDLETIELGIKIGKLIKDEKVIILLEGGLAAGKTTLTKGIAKGLGITQIIKSPTFTIMKKYPINDNKSLYHLDLYRLTEMGMDFDLEEYIYEDNSIAVIEWPNQVEDLLPNDHIKIKISGFNDSRVINITSTSENLDKVVDKIWMN